MNKKFIEEEHEPMGVDNGNDFNTSEMCLFKVSCTRETGLDMMEESAESFGNSGGENLWMIK